MKNIIIMLLLSLFVVSCGSKKSKQIEQHGIHYEEAKELSKVFAIATQQEKPLFFYMNASWCVPCHFMEDNVFTNKKTIAFMNNNFVNYKADIDDMNGQLASINHGIRIVPTLVFFDGKGSELYRYEGSLTNEKLMEICNIVLNLDI